MEYKKPATKIEEQIDLLEKRGMLIAERIKAHHYLSNISYYRLAGYWWPMQADKATHIFKPGTTIEDVV
jgi:abortive infection bacteriophage resistance protein